VKIETLWSVIVDGLAEVWPTTRTSVNGVSLGDVWPCDVLKTPGTPADSTEHLVPFHKLSQWLTYSLIEPMIKISNITFEGVEHLTGLPEYRNGKNTPCDNLKLNYAICLKKKNHYSF
jgi:hypothetical protein